MDVLQQQITRLEQVVQSQQTTIESLKQNRDFLLQDLSKQIDQQIDTAAQMRGSIGSEYLNITKFISKQIAHGMTRLQEEAARLVSQSLPVKTIQDLEKKYLVKPAATLDLETLTNRLTLLETAALTAPSQTHAQPITEVPQQEELERLKAHVNHLETVLLQEVQKAYKTVHKPGDYGAPLTRLQAQVDMLRQDVTTIKSVDGQSLAESLLANTVSSLRSEFRQNMATKAAHADLRKFQTDISRIEQFSREVQTGFYDMKSKQERALEDMSVRFSADSLNAVEAKLKRNTEILIAGVVKEQQHAFSAQQSKLQETVATLLETGTRLEMEVKSKYGPETLAQHIRQVQAAITAKNTEFQETLNTETKKSLSIMSQEIDALRRQQKEFTARISAELDSSALKQKYSEFSGELEKQTEFFGAWKKNLETVKQEQLVALAGLEGQFSEYKKQVKDTDLEISGIRKSIQDAKQVLKAELGTWMQEREVILQKKFSDTEAEIQQVRDNYLLLQTDMFAQLQEHRQKEKDKYAEFQKTLWAKFESWLTGRDEYLTQRTLDMNKQIQSIVAQANKRENELAVLYSEKTLREFVLECERRLRLAQDSWMTRRTEELQLKYSELDRNSSLFKRLAAEAEAREIRLSEQYGEKVMTRYVAQISMKLLAFQALLRDRETGVNTKEKQYAGLTKCFYTAIFAKQGLPSDKLAPVENKIPGWRYICFTNVQMDPVPGWQIVRVWSSSAALEPRLEAKKYKWLSHQLLADFDIAVWVDAYIAPNPMYSELLKQWILEMIEQNKYIAHRPHEERDCVYQECEAVVEHKRESSLKVARARDLLEEAKVPEHAGLFDTNIVVRFHKEAVLQDISEKVYEYLKTVTYRDQLVVPLVYHKENFQEVGKYQLLRAFGKTGEHVRMTIQ
jgi:hypothetical protein